jgi:NAD(P)-dependent dehydrogenase (short-subunit alcohol dehydrogenase family)
MEFSGKTAFVTGAANGIGLGICRALARSGVNIVLTDIEKERLEAARRELSAFNIRTRAIEVECPTRRSLSAPRTRPRPNSAISIFCSTTPACR